MRKAIVLGGGMIGSVMALDFAAPGPGEEAFEVTVADAKREALNAAQQRCAAAGAKVTVVQADLSSAAEIRKLVAPCDMVLGALASRIGFASLRTVIEAGKNYCDISFFAEEALDLHELAQARGVTAVFDCGVAPGMSNMLAGHEAAKMDAQEIEIYVGGLPRERRWPFQYKAAFAPSDVIEEYTRPTRLVEHGKVVVREALTEPELLDLPGIGTLEAVNTDGLRSLARTMRVPFMKEKTLRYPGHYELMRVFRATGLFGTDEIEVGGVRVKPRDVIAKLMFPQWTYEKDEEDLTVMRIMVAGVRAGKRVRVTWDLLDYYDRETHATSMARTTALPCTIVARLIAAGKISARGVIAPEQIGTMPGMTEAVIASLGAKRVRYTRREETIS